MVNCLSCDGWFTIAHVVMFALVLINGDCNTERDLRCQRIKMHRTQ